MCRTETAPRIAAIAALGLAVLLGGCSADMYLDRRDTVSFSAGDAKAANAVTHMVDPWPRKSGDKNIAFNGERMQSAAERYRTGKTTPLSTASTSSVQYAPVVAPVK
jgi:hypothetical protein